MTQRSTIDESTELTPTNIIFGRQVRLPVDIRVGRRTDRLHSLDNYLLVLENQLEKEEKKEKLRN